MGKRNKNKHRHQNHNQHHNHQHNGQCGCENHQNNQQPSERLDIDSEEEMVRLMNMIMTEGRIKNLMRQQKAIDLADAMMADAGITEADLVPPPDVVASEAVDDGEPSI